MQPKDKAIQNRFQPTPLAEVLKGAKGTPQSGPLDDLPPGIPLGQMLDVATER